MAIKVSGTEVISDDKRILNNESLPDIRPSLLLDFANSKTLDPRITFTRGSTATYWDGKTTAKAEENLLTYSEQIDAFSKSGVTVTANATTAPDGSSTADLVTEDTATSQHVVWNGSFSAGTNSWAASIYAKANGRSWLAVEGIASNNFYAWFDLSTGSTGTAASGTTASITDVGNGWYRCIVTKSISSGSSGNFRVYLANADNTTSYTGDGTSGIYIWGAQLEQRSSATAYTATTTSPIVKYQPMLQTAASGEARFDHDPVTGESKGLLIEESRTNLYQNSEVVTDTDQSSITSNTIIAPDGTLTADKVVEDTQNSEHGSTYANYSYTSGTTYTFSVFAKADDTRTAIRLLLPAAAFGDNLTAYYDLSSGVARQSTNASSNPDAYSIEDVGNGWYRCSITAAATITATSTATQLRVLDNYASDNTVYTGDGYSGVYLWGAQLEQGSFPTSYIPTSGSTVTRAVDSARISGNNFSSWFSHSEGTILCDAETFATYATSGSFPRMYEFTANPTTGTLQDTIRVTSAVLLDYTDYRARVYYNGSEDFSVDTLENSNGKLSALAFKTDDFGFAYGGALETDTSGNIPPNIAMVWLGSYGTASSQTNNIHIKKFAFYPKRLPNATLQAMTEE